MKPNTKILSVQANGQICIGKAFAGEILHMEVIDGGRIVLTPVTIRPKHHETFFTPEAEAQLKEFKAWRAEKPTPATGSPEEVLSRLIKDKE